MSAREDVIHGLFPTCVGEAWYPRHADEKESMVAAIHSIRDADDEGRKRCEAQNQGGYTSYFSRRDLQGEPAFAGLVAFLSERAQAYAAYQKWDLQRFQLPMSSLWINVNPQGSYHADHIHPYSYISGVYYLRCEAESGDIAFQDPRPARSMSPPAVTEPNAANLSVVVMRPEEGKALLFPAWLTHGVRRNSNAAERISVSFNFDMRPR